MAAHTFEQQIGEKRDCCGVYDSEAFQPRFTGIVPAVRRKAGLVLLIEVPVYLLKELLGASCVCVRQSASAWDGFQSQMPQLTHLDKHRCLYLTQRVETLDDGIEHREQMMPAVKRLHIFLTAMLATDFKDFLLV